MRNLVDWKSDQKHFPSSLEESAQCYVLWTFPTGYGEEKKVQNQTDYILAIFCMYSIEVPIYFES